MILYKFAKWMEEWRQLCRLIKETKGDISFLQYKKKLVEDAMLDEADRWFGTDLKEQHARRRRTAGASPGRGPAALMISRDEEPDDAAKPLQILSGPSFEDAIPPSGWATDQQDQELMSNV